jgi:hypothetical protein
LYCLTRQDKSNMYFQNARHHSPTDKAPHPNRHSPTDKAPHPNRPEPLNSKLFVYTDDIQSTINNISTTQVNLIVQ